MKGHETANEAIVGGHVAGHGFDEPRSASCGETATRGAAGRANGPVKAAQWPADGALPAPSTRQAHRLLAFFFVLVQTHAGQPGMSHHRQGDVPRPPVPEAHFVLIQSGLPLGLLNALLDGVPRGGDPNERFEGGSRRRVGQRGRHLRGIRERTASQQPDVGPGKPIPAFHPPPRRSSDPRWALSLPASPPGASISGTASS